MPLNPRLWLKQTNVICNQKLYTMKLWTFALVVFHQLGKSSAAIYQWGFPVFDCHTFACPLAQFTSLGRMLIFLFIFSTGIIISSALNAAFQLAGKWTWGCSCSHIVRWSFWIWDIVIFLPQAIFFDFGNPWISNTAQHLEP